VAPAHVLALTRPDWPGVLVRWTLDPFALLLVLAVGAAYAWACRQAASSGRAVPRSWILWFGAGLGVLAVALCSPLDTYADTLFSAHMTQHLLLELCVPPLLLLGNPTAVAIRARPRLRRPLRHPAVHAVGHPLVGWLALPAANWGAHWSPLYDAAIRSNPVHAMEHGLFLTAGLLFWTPILGRPAAGRTLPHGARMVYILLAAPLETFLAFAIFSERRNLYPAYAGVHRAWGPSVLADQRAGAAVMWVVGDAGLVLALLVTAAAWMRHEERITAMLEAAEDSVSGRPGPRAVPSP
jgi:cytochrome c oxidase assembly factor CtaG